MGKRPIGWFIQEFPYEFLGENEKGKKIIRIKFTKEIVEVPDDVYMGLIKERNNAKKIQNEIDRHQEHSELNENSLYERAFIKQEALEEEVEKRVLVETSFEELSTLPLVQRRRIIKYYLQKKTYEEIAKEENCSKVAVKYSIDLGIEKISKKMKF